MSYIENLRDIIWTKSGEIIKIDERILSEKVKKALKFIFN
jgi:hypothetical protein